MTMDQPLHVERRAAVAWLILNRPDDANSIDVAMAQALLDATIELEADSSIRALVITGAGRMFCAGGDIKAFTAGDDAKAAIDAITTPLHAAIKLLMAIDKPVITLVNGPAAGAGLGLAILGDFVLAARSARFTSAYTAIGLTPDGGTSWFLPRLVGLRRASEMVFTNRAVGAEEADRIGLITRAVADETLQVEGSELAQRLADMPVTALARSRALLAEGLGRSLSDHLEVEARTIAQSACAPEGRTGIASFLERRDAKSTGPDQT